MVKKKKEEALVVEDVLKYMGYMEDMPFEPELLIYINASAQACKQILGTQWVGKTIDEATTWKSLTDEKYLDLVKAIICLKTKLVYDPPPSSSKELLVESLRENEERLVVSRIL